MFPEIFTDDVFRLETRRLWLRWPTARDESSIQRFGGLKEVAEMTAAIPHPYPEGGAASFIYHARVSNAQGTGLTFALSPLARPYEAIGIVDLCDDGGTLRIGYWLAPPCWGRGLMSEAVSALVDTTFQLTTIRTIHADARIDNIASRRILEKCGFARTGDANRHFPMRNRHFTCATYQRERADLSAIAADAHTLLARSA